MAHSLWSALLMSGVVGASARPLIVNQGSVDVGDLCEQTPLMIGGELWRYESVHIAYHDSATPGKSYQRFVHVETGNVTPPFGAGYALGSAMEADGLVYAFASFCGTADACGAATSNLEIRVFWSTDKMQTWQSATAIDARGKKYSLWNTSVNKGKLNGKDVFVMAFETRDGQTPGGWNTIFATAEEPKGPWTVLDTDVYGMTLDVEHADPSIRFVPDATGDAGWWYVITARASLGVACADSSPRFFGEIFRTRDFKTWENGDGMGTQTAVDGMIKPNGSVDRRSAGRVLSPKQAAYMAKNQNVTDTWIDCNASDMDLCEVGNQTVIFWTWGHQSTYGGLVRAYSPMKLSAFLEGWFTKQEPIVVI